MVKISQKLWSKSCPQTDGHHDIDNSDLIFNPVAILTSIPLDNSTQIQIDLLELFVNLNNK